MYCSIVAVGAGRERGALARASLILSSPPVSPTQAPKKKVAPLPAAMKKNAAAAPAKVENPLYEKRPKVFGKRCAAQAGEARSGRVAGWSDARRIESD